MSDIEDSMQQQRQAGTCGKEKWRTMMHLLASAEGNTVVITHDPDIDLGQDPRLDTHSLVDT